MKHQSLFLGICLTLFTTLLAGPAFAGSVDNNPGNCPFPSYSGCKRYVESETFYSKKDKDGLVYAGGGSPTDNFIYGEVHSNELFISYNSVIINEEGDIVDLYGGAAPMNSQANRNRVVITSGSRGNNIYGGYSKGRGTISNIVEVNSATADGNVVGGWSDSTFVGQSSTNNILRLSNSTIVKGDAVGGQTTGNGINASLNEVLIYDNTQVAGSVYGGRATGGGDVSKNAVRVTDNSSIGKNVYGGHAVGSAKVSDNIVLVTGNSNVAGSLYGGYSEGAGLVISNRAEASGGTVGELFGGYSDFGNTQGNMATVSGGSVAGPVYGGRSGNAGSASGNTAVISSGTVGHRLYGGYSDAGVASGNTARMDGGTIVDNMYGGHADNANAVSNVALVYGGDVQEVFGGYSSASGYAASGNTVEIDGGKVANNVYGGRSGGGGSATGNAARFVSGSVGTSVYGGYSPHEASGNLAEMSAAAGILSGELVGGYSSANGYAASGNTARLSAGKVGGLGVFGGWSDSGFVVSNTASVTGGEVTSDVMGGYVQAPAGSAPIIARGNTALVSGGIIGSSVIGALIEGQGDAINNLAQVSGSGAVPGDVIGAITSGQVIGNRAQVSGWSVDGDVVGGTGGGTVNDNATGNRAVVLDADIGGNVIGGRSYTGAASGNTAYMSGGTAGKIYAGDGITYASNNILELYSSTVSGDAVGGHTADGRASGNQFTLVDSKVSGEVAGGRSLTGAASGNTLNMKGGAVGNLYGGSAATDSTDNVVAMDGGSVSGDVIGGNALNGEATGNSAALDGGSVTGSLVGGRGTLNASGNSVSLYSGVVSMDVIGGDNAGSAVNNTVNLQGGAVRGRVLGGSDYTTYTGNTLVVRGFFGTVQEVNNFENYSLQIPAALGAGSTLLTISGLTPTDLSRATVTSFSLDPSGQTHYESGDVITLISNTSGNSSIDTVYKNLARGVSTLYDVRVLEQGNALVAVVEEGQSNPQSQTLAGPMLGGLTLVNLGADLVAGNALDQAWKSSKNCEEGGRWSFFSSFTYEDMSIDSKIDSKGWSYLAGLAWRDGNDCDYGFLGGLFFETGYADYDGSRSYSGVGQAKFDGNVRYYGWGTMARYRLANSLRLEASARFGKVDSDYAASQYAGGQKPSYNLNTWYFGAHAGAGWDVDLADWFNLDFSAKYFWVRQLGKTVSVCDERIEFKDADSHRLKAGTRLTLMANERLDFFAGAYYEQELGGDIRASNRTTRRSIDTLDMDGSSGVFEFGISVMPTASRDLVVDLMLSGSTGTREGFGGHMSLGWNF